MSGMSYDVTGLSNDVGQECYMTVIKSWQVFQ